MPQTASTLAAVNVLGAFTDGGNFQQRAASTANNYELQNLTSISSGKHQVVVGGRWRDLDISNTSNQNFDGTFTFPTLDAYQITQQGLAAEWAPAQIRAAGGGASQFQITTGNPLASVNVPGVHPGCPTILVCVSANGTCAES